MGQLGQGVGPIHELGELAAAEKFLDGCYDGPNIYKALWGNRIHVLNGHPLFNDPFHPGQAYTKLILQEFTYRAKAPVSEVVDVINFADFIGEVNKVVNSCNNIFYCNVLFRPVAFRTGSSEYPLLITFATFGL